MAGFTAPMFQAFSSNIPPPIASGGAASLEGPANLMGNLSIPNPLGGMKSAPSIPTSYNTSIQAQANQGASGQNNVANPSTGVAAPIMTHVVPRKIHSAIKESLPSIGQLYAPKLGGPKLGRKK